MVQTSPCIGGDIEKETSGTYNYRKVILAIVKFGTDVQVFFSIACRM